MVAVWPGPWRRAAALAAVAATVALAGVAGRSKGSWSAWLKSWSLENSYGKTRDREGGLAVALPARARCSPARTRAVCGGLRVSPGSGTGADALTVHAAPRLAAAAAGHAQRARLSGQAQASGWCALRPSLVAAALRRDESLPPAARSLLRGTWALPMLPADSLHLVRLENRGSLCGPS